MCEYAQSKAGKKKRRGGLSGRVAKGNSEETRRKQKRRGSDWG